MNEAPIRKPTTLGDVTVETSLYPIEGSLFRGRNTRQDFCKA